MALKVAFVLGFVLCATGLVSPPFALALGLLYGFAFVHPFHSESRTATKFLLQASVVGLGFGMNLHQVLRAGRSGFVYTALSIAFAMTIGLLAGRFLGVNKTASALITVGTAICGGSAIAAVAPIIHADQEETAVSLGTIFILNSIALLIFPPLGALLHLSQQQFGLWAALAIHDTSSVVGAAARYGARRAGRRHHSEADSRAVDRAGIHQRRVGQALQYPYSMALVHRPFLSGGCREHIRHPILRALARAEHDRENWVWRPLSI